MKTRSLFLVAVAIACTKSDSPPADTVAATPVTPNVVHVMASDFAFDAPDTIPAGMTTFNLSRTGEPHHIQLLRLDAGKTFADFTAGLKAMKPTDPPPPWVHLLSGPNVPDSGTTSRLTLMAQPGTYALICFVEGTDRVPHVAKGMMRELTVIPSTTAAAPPPVADITVTMKDYTWDITPALTPGKHIIKLENAGPQPHELVILRIHDGKTPADVAKWAATFVGAPPFSFGGGASMGDPGTTSYVEVDLAPGTYMLLCFFADAKDGKPHLEHGMAMPVKVG